MVAGRDGERRVADRSAASLGDPAPPRAAPPPTRSAVILDTELANQVLPYECDLAGLPPFDTSYFAPVMRGDAPPAARAALAAAALAALQDGTMAQLLDEYYGRTLPACFTGEEAASVAVTFDQVRPGPLGPPGRPGLATRLSHATAAGLRALLWRACARLPPLRLCR